MSAGFHYQNYFVIIRNARYTKLRYNVFYDAVRVQSGLIDLIYEPI